MKTYYAHSTSNPDKSDWQKLSVHLENVAKKAKKFAEIFRAGQWSALAGHNHDLGKGTLAWQAYLRQVNNVTDEFTEFYEGHPVHAAVGAQWLYQHSNKAGKLLAYCIAGHHGGLPNWNDLSIAALEEKLKEQCPEINFPHFIPEFPKRLPFQPDPERFGFQLQFFARMLFSCLVDADYLDTEASLMNS